MITLKKLTFYFILLLIILFSVRNYFSTTSQFFFSNLSIRDGFNYENNSFFDANNDGKLDFVKKGSHEGGQEYFERIYEYIDYLKDFDFNKIYSLFLNLKDVDINHSQFRKEYDLIMLLKKYSKINKINKQKLWIHIPKSNSVFWNISCDKVMIPLIVPAISNIAMIEGIPIVKDSCYGDRYGVGFQEYKNRNLIGNSKILSTNELCKKAKRLSFKRVIEIRKDQNNFVKHIVHECV